jgi:hypothetical protein
VAASTISCHAEAASVANRLGKCGGRLSPCGVATDHDAVGGLYLPPDPGFASRLRTLSFAADAEREACEEAAAAGLLWRPIPGAQGSQPPYELRPGTGRRGPAELWERFDRAVEDLNHAITGTNVVVVGRAFGELAAAAGALADAVDTEDRGEAAGHLRQQAG